ncbi:MAG: non-canonical purine NTP pyrophosphatase [Acidobacteriota bacterium]|nr:non-canonical purine NTP pyrophosphatase [Acidobacteriota bacterium]
MTLYIASSNAGKLRDFSAVTAIPLAPLPGLDAILAPAEDESTFEGNARVKAIFYSRHAPEEIVIADDSGLEVDALRGAPGVRSARFAENMHFVAPLAAGADERNNLCLRHALWRIPRPHPARYRCVLAAARNGEVLTTADGTVAGEILPSPRGTRGFGYDPLFYLPEYGKSMAELELQVKLRFSHRGRALAALLEKLGQEFDAIPPK